MTNSPIHEDVVARLRKGCLHATWDDPEGGKIYTGQVDVAVANGTMLEAADLIEALQRELAEKTEKAKELDAIAFQVGEEADPFAASEAITALQSQASSARRLALEEAVAKVDEVADLADTLPLEFGNPLTVSQARRVDLLRALADDIRDLIDPPAAIGDIKGAAQ